MLEADERPRVAARVPAPRAALDPPAATRRLPGLRRLPHPPGRRAPLWLAALVAGALVAAGPALVGDPEPVRVDASDFGLGIGGVDPSGEMSDAGARRGITEA